MKNQGNMTPPKDYRLLVTELNDMEIYSYLMKNSEIAVLRKLEKIQTIQQNQEHNTNKM